MINRVKRRKSASAHYYRTIKNNLNTLKQLIIDGGDYLNHPKFSKVTYRTQEFLRGFAEGRQSALDSLEHAISNLKPE